MSKEKYLQIKKEYRIRLALVIVLFILFAILDCILIYSSSRFIPLLATAMGSVVPLNHFLLVPFWQQKKAIEEQHPEWKELSPKGVRVPALEANKRTLAGIGVALVLLFSFAMFYKPVEQRQEINFKELNDISKLNSLHHLEYQHLLSLIRHLRREKVLKQNVQIRRLITLITIFQGLTMMRLES